MSLENVSEKVAVLSKEVYFPTFLLQKVFDLASAHSYHPFKIKFNSKESMENTDGSTTTITYPVTIDRDNIATAEKLGKGFEGEFILARPHNDHAYLVYCDNRDWSDGENTNVIAITKVPDTSKCENLKQWVENLGDQISPFDTPLGLNEKSGPPGILIWVGGGYSSVHKRGDDTLLNEIFNIFH